MSARRPPVFVDEAGQKCVSMAGAAVMLGVSKQRVHQLVKEKRLVAKRLRGSELRLVALEAVHAFRRRKPPGRPKSKSVQRREAIQTAPPPTPVP